MGGSGRKLKGGTINETRRESLTAVTVAAVVSLDLAVEFQIPGLVVAAQVLVDPFDDSFLDLGLAAWPEYLPSIGGPFSV